MADVTTGMSGDELAARIQKELDRARAATDRADKAAHLNRASVYATARERAVATGS